MTIYHRLKVWGIKTYRFFRYGFKQVRPRTTNQIFPPIYGICDYCGNDKQCAVLECDYEVYAKICNDCLQKAKDYLAGYAGVADKRGVVTN